MRVPNDLFSRRTQQHVLQASPPVCCHHDEVALVAVSVATDLCARVAFANRGGRLRWKSGLEIADQLFEALKVQVQEDLEKETHRLVGAILMEQGAMTPEQKDEVLEVLEGLRHVFWR